MPRPPKIITKKYLNDEEVNNLEGKWIDNSYMKLPVIDYNCDCSDGFQISNFFIYKKNS